MVFIRCLPRLIRLLFRLPIAEGTGREARVNMDINPRSSSQPPADRHLWEIVPVFDLLVVGAVLFLLWFGYVLRGVFTPVLIGLGLAYLFNPVITKSQMRWRVPRVVSTSVLVIVILLVVAGFIAWFGPLTVEQVQTLAKKTPQYMQSLSSRYGIQLGDLSTPLEAFTSKLQNDPMSILRSLLAGTGSVFGVIGLVIGATTNLALAMVLIPIYFFFFAWQFDRIDQIIRFFPASKRERILHILRRMDHAVSGFFSGRFLIGLLTAGMYAGGWAFVDVPYWFLLGVVTGFLTIVPYLSAVGWPLAILLKYLDVITGDTASFGWLPVVVWPSLVYLIVQLVESWVLTPLVQSRALDMNAITVIIVVFIGGAVGGFYGLLLSIPIAACIKILIQELVLPRLERWAAKS